MFEVYGFYKFKKITALKKNKTLMQDLLVKKDIKGTIIIAKEGINATISGKSQNLRKTILTIKKILCFKKFDCKNTSRSKFQPFHKAKVKIKKEVVPMNLTINSIERNLNTHLNPKEWNDLIKKKRHSCDRYSKTF